MAQFLFMAQILFQVVLLVLIMVMFSIYSKPIKTDVEANLTEKFLLLFNNTPEGAIKARERFE